MWVFAPPAVPVHPPPAGGWDGTGCARASNGRSSLPATLRLLQLILQASPSHASTPSLQQAAKASETKGSLEFP